MFVAPCVLRNNRLGLEKPEADMIDDFIGTSWSVWLTRFNLGFSNDISCFNRPYMKSG